MCAIADCATGISFGGLIVDRQLELEHLDQANRRIAEGEVRVTAQAALVERMKTAHQEVGDAEILLGLLRDTLAEWYRQRGLIVAALEK